MSSLWSVIPNVSRNETLALCEKILGDENALTITVMKNLAEILYDGGKVEKALVMIDVAEMLAQEVFGEDSPRTQEIIELHDKFLNE